MSDPETATRRDATEVRSPAERRRARQRRHLVDAALDLFEQQGFDATTVDEISAAGDVSPRTFFRYFDSKNDVVLGEIVDSMTSMRERLVARPADETMAEAISEVVAEVFVELSSSERFVRCLRLMMSSTTLMAGVVAKTPLADVLAMGIVDRDPTITAEEAQIAAVVGAALIRHGMGVLLTADSPDQVAAFTRRTFELSHQVWALR